ncbi:MAG TPA: hypothetical protein VGF86_12220 [Candidatus Tumulicola sp.]|jgi:hypothetical protein
MIPRWVAVTITASAGAYYAIVGALLWEFPAFFYAHVGHIGAYNAHYERDLGSFLLPIGVGLFYVSPAPEKHRTVMAIVAVASVLHALSHLVEGVHSGLEGFELAFFSAVALALLAVSSRRFYA